MKELIETIGVLRRENASLQAAMISKFLTGKAFVVPPIVRVRYPIRYLRPASW